MATRVTNTNETMAPTSTKEPGKCSLCMSKFLCCRRTNKVQEQTIVQADASSEGATAAGRKRTCCWCIPCGTKKAAPNNEAWTEERRESILSQPEKR